jgi:hypothetical protein
MRVRFLEFLTSLVKKLQLIRVKQLPPPKLGFGEDKATKFILTIWKKELLDKSWPDLVSCYDAISVKIVDGSTPYRHSDAKKIFSKIASEAIEHHGWGFHYCTTSQDARAEAAAAAEACLSVGVVAYHWNAEKFWENGVNPVNSAITFAKAFKAAAPGIKLYANCFSSPVTNPMLADFDYFEPMLYGTRRSTIEKKFSSRLGRDDIDSSKKSAMVGTGRKDEGNSRRAWGYLSPAKGRTKPFGLAQLIATYRPISVNFFRAGRAGGEDIMVEGNTINPSLGEQVLFIREFLQEEVDCG